MEGYIWEKKNIYHQNGSYLHGARVWDGLVLCSREHDYELSGYISE
jgi:hypothetical protein